MVSYGFRPTAPEAPNFKVIEKPYWKLTINARDIEKCYYSDFTDWIKGPGLDYGIWNSDLDEGSFRLIGGTTGDVTKTISLEEDGYYLIMLRVLRNAQYTGKIRLYVDNNLIWKDISTSTASGYGHTETIMFPIAWYKRGNHNFKINFPVAPAYASEIFIYPIKRYVASSDKASIEKRAIPLDLLSVEFTENNVAENNILTATLSLENKLFNENNESLLFTDFSDPVTFELGHEYKYAIPKFGGYVIAPVISNGNIVIKCMDRMLDMVMQPCYKNIAIGTPPDGNYTQFNNVYDVGQYLTSIIEYPLTFNKQNAEETLAVYFNEQKNYNKVQPIAGYTKTFNDSLGTRIKPSNVSNSGEIILWQSSEPYNAYKYTNFGFTYNFGAFPSLMPINVAVYMHKAGQDISKSVKYNIQFSGPSPTTNKIGTVGYVNTNAWSWFDAPLKAWFDTVTPSTEYWISKISITGAVDANMVTNANNYGMYTTALTAYKAIADNPQFNNADTSNCYEVMKRLCKETSYVACIVPGKDRTEDYLYMVPDGITGSPVDVDENKNVIEVNTWNYDPLSDGLCTQRRGTYDIGGTINKSYAWDINAIKKYRRVKTSEELADIMSTAQGQASVQRYVDENKLKKIGTEINVNGNVAFRPYHFVLTNIGSVNLKGNYQIEGIAQSLDIESEIFNTTLGINRLPGEFKRRQKALMEFYKNNRTVRY